MIKNTLLQYIVVVGTVLNTVLLLLLFIVKAYVVSDVAINPSPANNVSEQTQETVKSQTEKDKLHIDNVNHELEFRFIVEEDGIYEVTQTDSDYGQDGVLKTLRVPSLILGKTTNFAWDQRIYEDVAMAPNEKWVLLQGSAWEAGFWQIASVNNRGWAITWNVEFDEEFLGVDNIEWLADSRLRVRRGCDVTPETPELSAQFDNTCFYESISNTEPWKLKLISKEMRVN